MNKKIPTGVGIVVIVIVAAICALGIWKASQRLNQLQSAPNTITKTMPAASKKTKDQSCLASGGAISTATCCGQTQDFPNNCAIGACGCAPASSHQIKTCECGAGKCFDGNSCVQSAQSRGGNAVEPGSRGGQKQCSMEAKVCPDGSAVGRTGLNCEFAPCP